MVNILLSGTTACSGKVKGRVKIIQDEFDDEAMMKSLLKVNQGDIIVTQMTRPLFVVAMHKVSAIVTDRGGMLCHAAMVAREFKVPCIVGTENAITTAGSFTVTNGKNLVTGGPFTIASGHTVTVGSGATWVVV